MMKRPERFRRSSRLSPVEHLETRSLMTMTSTAPLPDLNVATGAAVAPINLDSYYKDPAASPDYAIFDTSLGTIPVLLTPKTTPITVANFQNYVNNGEYTDTIVHRSVPGFIWQAGGFQMTSAAPGTTTANIATIAAGPAIQNEFGASNVRGTIAMAKLGSDPNSATDEFFFNESNSNASNLDNQNGGFTVFGHVVGAQGLAVMDAIASVPVPASSPFRSPLDQIPLQNYTAGAAVQPSNLVLIKGVTTANEAFQATSDTPGVANATVQGSNLIVTPVTSGTAHVTVMAYGSDGVAATETFAVNVASSPQSGATPITTPPTSGTPIATLPPPTSTGAVTAQPIAATPSVLSVAATRGSVPASAVSGQKVKLQETITLTASKGPITQSERVALVLAPSTTDPAGEITIAGASTTVKLKAGKQARLNLSAKPLSPGVPAGAYHVLVTVTDPDGSMTTVDTGKSLVVRAPQAKPAAK